MVLHAFWRAACAAGAWGTVATVQAVAGVDAEDVAALIVSRVNEHGVCHTLLLEMAEVIEGCVGEAAVPEKLRSEGAALLVRVRGL